MRIRPATPDDLAAIRGVYEEARALQIAHRSVVWPAFTDAAILREIESGALFCVVDDTTILGVFSILRDDALIWGERERGQHLYLHRIARSSVSHPGGIVGPIVRWSFALCASMGRAGLRMDTWSENAVLISYYATLGFAFVEARRLPADPRLSAHYHGIEIALLEAQYAAPSASESPR